MGSIADAGRAHLADAITGKLSHCVVSEWKGADGEPVEIYWRPLTGETQKRIEGFGGLVERNCATVKFRALDKSGRLVFGDTPIESLMHDFDYSVIRAIAFLMQTDLDGGMDEIIGESAGE